jgi:hypothetical protein
MKNGNKYFFNHILPLSAAVDHSTEHSKEISNPLSHRDTTVSGRSPVRGIISIDRRKQQRHKFLWERNIQWMWRWDAIPGFQPSGYAASPGTAASSGFAVGGVVVSPIRYYIFHSSDKSVN